MKLKFLLICLTTCLMIVTCFVYKSCNSYREKKDLYDKIDYFVENLSNSYVSYGLFSNEKKMTTKGTYHILPIGRLINVKIYDYNVSYEKLKEDIKDHYKNNKTVKDVYICKAGTIMVDCRRY